MKKKNHNKFINCARSEASKIELTERKTKFIEIYNSFSQNDAEDQSERCLECGNPYCQWKCPLHNYIPNWLKLVHDGRIIEAVNLSHQTNSFPEVCGRVCPQERLCEGSCTLDDGFGAVAIGNVEKYITDQAFAEGWSLNYPPLTSTKRVAIIGAGPAGLACADVLARYGIKSVVYDRQAHVGGLLTYGIPAFKLEKNIITRRQQILSNAGVEFKLNCEIGRDIQLSELESEYDAIFIGVGTYQSVQDTSISSEQIGVIKALDFLTEINQHILTANTTDDLTQVKDKTVVVLGGGDTTMDCLRSSLRLGAKQVIGVYRRSVDDLPGSKREYANACEEGAEFIFNAQPIGIIQENGVLTGVKFIQTSLVESKDSSSTLQHIEGSEFIIDADLVITAFGFKPESLPWLDQQVETDQYGRIKTQSTTQQTHNTKIFAGGDIVRGASLVVHAIADGMQAGHEILEFLA